MKSKIKSIIILFCIFLLNNLVWAYRWPLRNQDEQHEISATLGEYRPTYYESDRLIFEHFHEGVDITPPLSLIHI